MATTWDGGGGDNLASTSGNWDNGVPAVGNDATFDGTSVKDCTWDIATTVGAVTMATAYTGTLTQSSGIDTGAGALTIDGIWDSDDNTVDCDSMDIQANANIDFSNSTITVSGGTIVADVASIINFTGSGVTIDGTGNLANPRSTNRFNNLTLIGAIVTTLTDDVHIGGVFTTGTGTIQDDGVANRTITLRGSIVNQGPTWNVVTGLQFSFDNSSAFTLPGDDYSTITMRVLDVGVVSLGGNVTCGAVELVTTGDLAHLDMVTHDLACSSLTVGGNNSSSNGRLDCGEGQLLVTGNILIRDSNEAVTGRDNEIRGEDATIVALGNITIESTTDAGVFTPGTSRLVLVGSGTQTITSAGSSFFDVTVINTTVGGTVFTDAASITGTLRASAWTADILISFDETASHAVNEWAFTGTGGFSVQLRSQVGANQWDCALTTGGRADHVDVQDSNLTGATMLVGDPSNTDSGNNSALWDFADAGRSGAPAAAAGILFGD